MVKRKKEKLLKTKKKFDRILSLDMGSKNLAFGVLANQKLEALGFIENTVHNLIDPYFLPNLKAFGKEFESLLQKYKPDVVLMERFQNRGMFKGNSSEYLNIMIGIISAICLRKKLYVYLTTASQWKLQFSRQFPQWASVILVKRKGKTVEKKLTPLDNLYEELKPFPNHMIDAHLQGFYLANLWDTNQYRTWKKKPLVQYAKKWIKENGSKAKR